MTSRNAVDVNTTFSRKAEKLKEFIRENNRMPDNRTPKERDLRHFYDIFCLGYKYPKYPQSWIKIMKSVIPDGEICHPDIINSKLFLRDDKSSDQDESSLGLWKLANDGYFDSYEAFRLWMKGYRYLKDVYRDSKYLCYDTKHAYDYKVYETLKGILGLSHIGLVRLYIDLHKLYMSDVCKPGIKNMIMLFLRKIYDRNDWLGLLNLAFSDIYLWDILKYDLMDADRQLLIRFYCIGNDVDKELESSYGSQYEYQYRREMIQQGYSKRINSCLRRLISSFSDYQIYVRNGYLVIPERLQILFGKEGIKL